MIAVKMNDTFRCYDCNFLSDYGNSEYKNVCFNCARKRKRWVELSWLGRQTLIDIILQFEFPNT